MSSMFGSLGDQYAELWKAIIRPPRDVYDVRELGPSVFSVDHRAYQRSDMVLTNNRGMRLMCSHFEPVASERKAKRLPCCVYLHGNCSSRLEAISILAVVLPLQISVFAFDFAGSGLSDGEYVSLGHYERDDLQVVVEHLRNLGTVSSIALWGRSMGAVTALMHGDRDPSIAGMILDSPFSSLESLAQELVNVYVNVSIPTWMVSGALWMIKNSIKTKADFDIDELNPLEHVDKCFIPALFCSAYNDTFIKPAHTTRLYEKYAGDKNFLMIEGDHNSQRMKFFMDSAAIFLCATLRCEPLTESNLSEMVTPDMLHPDPTRLVPQPFKTSRGRDRESQKDRSGGHPQENGASSSKDPGVPPHRIDGAVTTRDPGVPPHRVKVTSPSSGAKDVDVGRASPGTSEDRQESPTRPRKSPA